MKTMPNPTRRRRERVVELLRCAADVAVTGNHSMLVGPATTASMALSSDKRTRAAAERIARRVGREHNQMEENGNG